MTTITIESESGQPIELKGRELAGVLAWLLPGLGHAYQGRWAKAGLFFVCLMGLYVHGAYLGSQSGPDGVGVARVVYFEGLNFNRLAFFCQLGIGVPAWPAVIQHVRVSGGNKPLWNGFMAPPAKADAPYAHDPDQPLAIRAGGGDLHARLHRFFELGTVYTMIAGLLNILAIYDACCGPVFPAKPEESESATEGGSAAA